MRAFLAELQRRNLYKVGAIYIVAAWVLIQVAATFEEALALPAWLDAYVIFAAIAGFPIALTLAWIFEITPQGVKRTTDLDQTAARFEDRPSRSIAVLPFNNLSNEPDDDPLADALSEDIITALSLSPTLTVTARNSTFAYKGTAPDIRRVGEELGVRLVVQGSVRRTGDGFRVTAQLIDAENGAHVWSEQYDRPTQDLSHQIDKLVRQIAAALYEMVLRYSASNVGEAEKGVSALAEMLLSTSYDNSTREEDLEKAIQHARNAVELDPAYALAHARIASTVGHRNNIGANTQLGDLEESLVEAGRALALAPNDPTVLAVCGYAMYYAGRYDEAIRNAKRSIELNPNIAYAYGVVAISLVAAGQYETALEYFDREEQLSPQSANLNSRFLLRGQALAVLGRFDESIAAFRRSIEMNPADPLGWMALAIGLQVHGNVEEAIEAVRRLKEIDRNTPLESYVRVLRGFIADEATAALYTDALTKMWNEAV
jgi:TolB-like protein/Flp pilus assembly protein TadD